MTGQEQKPSTKLRVVLNKGMLDKFGENLKESIGMRILSKEETMKMRRIQKRTLGICLTLLMLLMTACGGYEGTGSGSQQGYESSAQTWEAAGTKEDASIGSQGYESVAHESVPQEPAVETEEPSEGAFEALQGEAPDAQESTFETGEPSPSQDNVNDNLPTYGGYYYDLTNVVLYLELYDELPSNYITKNEARELGWEGGSVEKYLKGAAIGGDTFGNREGLLPKANGRSYTECDIDTNGYSSRGSRRLVFSNDGLYFYTADHYETFSEVTVTEEYKVIW